MAAANHFANIPELLVAVGSHVRNKQTLYNLCLTSRLCHAVFTEALYREIQIILNSDNIEVLRTLAEIDSVRFAHTFSCTMKSRNGSAELSYELHHQINLLAERILGRMKELTVLRWHGLVLANFVMHSLRRWCPKLRSVSIGFPKNQNITIYSRRQLPVLKPKSEAMVRLSSAQALTPLAQLTSLSLTRLPLGIHQGLAGRIATVLRQSPNLHALRLSVVVDAIWQRTNTSLHQLLDDVCTAYVGSSSGPPPAPLRLQALQLGVGFWVQDHVHSLRNFSKMINTSRLETLYLDTNIACFDIFWLETSRPSFRPWLPPRCPALRSFSVNMLSPSVVRFLHTCGRIINKPGWIRQIAFQAYSVSQEELWEPHHLQGVEGLLQRSVAEGWPLAFRAVRVGMKLDREHLSSEEIAEEVLGIVADACGNSAEGLALSINTAGYMSDEAKDVLVRGLARMRVLRQLWVGSMERLPPGVVRNTSMSSLETQALVLRLAGTVQTLEYVKIGDKAYKVRRRAEGAVWDPEPLDWPEQREVEMFHLPWSETAVTSRDI